MKDLLDLDQVVTDWLRDDAAAGAPRQVLVATLERVAAVAQDRPSALISIADGLDRAPRLRRVLMIAAIVTTLAVATILGAGLLDRWLAPPGPSNGWLVFVSPNPQGEDRGLNIARQGESMRTLVRSEAPEIEELCPRVSPDGRRLAYLTTEPHLQGDTIVERSAITIVELDKAGGVVGDPRRYEVSQFQRPSCPAWAADGNRLAFTLGSSVRALHADDGNIERLGPDRWCGTCNPGAPSWSPDNTEVAVGVGRLIWVLPTDGQEARSLEGLPATAFPGSHITTLEWSPDGRWFAVAGIGDGRGWVRLVDSQTGSAIELAEEPTTSVGGPAWSPDGARVAFVHQDRVWIVAVDGQRATDLPIDAAEGPRPPVVDPGGAPTPQWSPDGRLIGYVARLDPEGPTDIGAIAIVATDGVSPPFLISPAIPRLPSAWRLGADWQPVWPG